MWQRPSENNKIKTLSTLLGDIHIILKSILLNILNYQKLIIFPGYPSLFSGRTKCVSALRI